MSKDLLLGLAEDVFRIASAGVDNAGVGRLNRHLEDATAAAKSNPALQSIADDLRRTVEAEDDETPLPLLDLFQQTVLERNALAQPKAPGGELKEFPEGGYWSTPLTAESLYVLVPETRQFTKRAKAPEQIAAIEGAARRGVISDLRLLQLFLKLLNEKPGNEVADTVASVALPTFGPQILPELWPTLGPENRTFVAAYKIDIQSTLTRLLEKTGKKSDKSGSVMKAVKKLMESVSTDVTSVGPESLPLFKLALRYSPDPAFRHEIAETLAKIGPEGAQALPEMIDAFEKSSLTRDYHLIRPMVVLGKESPDVAEALIRALTDRDSVVRLITAFNLGQMGKVAFPAIPVLEDMAEIDPDQKVRDQAAKTLNKLRLKQSMLLAAEQEDEEEADEEETAAAPD